MQCDDTAVGTKRKSSNKHTWNESLPLETKFSAELLLMASQEAQWSVTSVLSLFYVNRLSTIKEHWIFDPVINTADTTNGIVKSIGKKISLNNHNRWLHSTSIITVACNDATVDQSIHNFPNNRHARGYGKCNLNTYLLSNGRQLLLRIFQGQPTNNNMHSTHCSYINTQKH